MEYQNYNLFYNNYTKIAVQLSRLLNNITINNIFMPETLATVQGYLSALRQLEESEYIDVIIRKNNVDRVYEHVKKDEFAAMGVVLIHMIRNELLNDNPNYQKVAILLANIYRIFRNNDLLVSRMDYISLLYQVYEHYLASVQAKTGEMIDAQQLLDNSRQMGTYIPEGLHQIPNELQTEIINLNRIDTDLERHNPYGLNRIRNTL